MFNMIEVVGVSPDSFSNAVKNALKTIHNQGYVPSWFEVVEQRGVVSNNEVREFQVKVKIGVKAGSAPKPASSSVNSKENDTCPTCKKPAGPKGHKCSPNPQAESNCDWCGAQITDARHLCDEKNSGATYICNSCGRAAINPDQVCDPKEIKK
ncbi:MAG: dodecin family protein [Candidatus Auribacterota bacterium]|jgi:flavin-binding protein dodecin|nr:dodecin family protein [Candidatus Auribacterota bacterium]